MRRVALGVLFAGIILLAALSFARFAAPSEAGQDAQSTPPPTNTARPTLPPTNTPRPSATPTATATATATSTPTSTPTDTPSPSPTPTVVGPDEYPEGFNPLTGLPYPNDEALNRRNLIVKISNFPEVVRPQTGLSKADIVIEYEVEGGVTRFAAIYRSQGTDHVGSVRSARLLDLELVPMFGALLAYSGSNEWIRAFILASDWKWEALSPHLGVNEPFDRFPQDGLAYEHTLFGDTFKMWQVATERQVNTPTAMRGLAFSDVPDSGGEAAQDIHITYYNKRQSTRWQYNPQDGRYYRWNSDLPHIDKATGQQLAADNVVLLSAEHVERPDVYESEIGGIAVEIQLWGSGDAWLFRDGRWYQGKWWHRQGKLGLWLTYDDGETPLHLKPGQTWIEIVRPGMWGVEALPQPVNAQATANAIYATQTQSFSATATAIAPYITPSPVPPTATPVDLP